MPEQPLSPADQEANTRKQKYLGLGVVGLGLVMMWHQYLISIDGKGTLAISLFVAGPFVSGVGLAIYARSLGTSAAWCMTALMPFLGPFMGLFGISLEHAWKSRRGTETKSATRRKLFGPVALFSLIYCGLVIVAVPNFLTYGAKARTSEAKVGLGGIFTSATSYFKENGTYEISDIKNLGYAPAGTPRYTFWYSVKGVPTRINMVGLDYARGCDGPPTVAKVAASATGFTAAARGNMDGDETCDEWSINDQRVLTNTINDVQN